MSKARPRLTKTRPRLTLRQLELLLEVLHAMSYKVVVRAGDLNAVVLMAHELVDSEETYPRSGLLVLHRNKAGDAHVRGFARGH